MSSLSARIATLLGDALRVGPRFADQLANCALDALVLLLEPDRGALFDSTKPILDCLQPVEQECGQLGSFRPAHRRSDSRSPCPRFPRAPVRRQDRPRRSAPEITSGRRSRVARSTSPPSASFF